MQDSIDDKAVIVVIDVINKSIPAACVCRLQQLTDL
jgi:hypothetical protein